MLKQDSCVAILTIDSKRLVPSFLFTSVVIILTAKEHSGGSDNGCHQSCPLSVYVCAQHEAQGTDAVYRNRTL